MSDENASTRFYKVVSHENNGDQTVQYAAWGGSIAALFLLGDPPSNGYIDSDPSAPTDDTAPRRVTVLYIFRPIKHQDELRKKLEGILNFEFMDELNSRPPIGDVDTSRFPADHLVLAELFA